MKSIPGRQHTSVPPIASSIMTAPSVVEVVWHIPVGRLKIAFLVFFVGWYVTNIMILVSS